MKLLPCPALRTLGLAAQSPDALRVRALTLHHSLHIV
jgi:hypothetical protein